MRLALFFALLGLINAAESYKILVFNPRYSQSLNNFLGNIADTLVDAGHNVVSSLIFPKYRNPAKMSNGRIVHFIPIRTMKHNWVFINKIIFSRPR